MVVEEHPRHTVALARERAGDKRKRAVRAQGAFFAYKKRYLGSTVYKKPIRLRIQYNKENTFVKRAKFFAERGGLTKEKIYGVIRVVLKLTFENLSTNIF